MRRGDEIISTGGHKAYITRVSGQGDVDAISCTNCSAILIRRDWVGITWKPTGNRHEGLAKILEDICNTQRAK